MVDVASWQAKSAYLYCWLIAYWHAIAIANANAILQRPTTDNRQRHCYLAGSLTTKLASEAVWRAVFKEVFFYSAMADAARAVLKNGG